MKEQEGQEVAGDRGVQRGHSRGGGHARPWRPHEILGVVLRATGARGTLGQSKTPGHQPAAERRSDWMGRAGR